MSLITITSSPSFDRNLDPLACRVKARNYMTEETKVEEKAVDEVVEETKVEESKADDFDYKAEYDKLNSNKEKEDHAWERTKKDLKEAKAKIKELSGDAQEDAPSKLEEEFASLRQELRGDKLEGEIETFTTDPYAKELVKANLAKYPDMTTEEAWFLANKPRLEGQLKEIKKAKESDTRKGDGSGAGQKEQKSTEPQLSPDDMKIINRMGLSWDGKMYKKEGGKFGFELVNGTLTQKRF